MHAWILMFHYPDELSQFGKTPKYDILRPTNKTWHSHDYTFSNFSHIFKILKKMWSFNNFVFKIWLVSLKMLKKQI